MSRTGWERWRDWPHALFVLCVQVAAYERGYPANLLDVNGDGPDMQLLSGEYIECKTRQSGNPNYSIKDGCYEYARNSPVLVYFVFDNWQVNTIDTLSIMGGPYPPSKPRGSDTDWLLVRPDTGLSFNDVFVADEEKEWAWFPSRMKMRHAALAQ